MVELIPQSWSNQEEEQYCHQSQHNSLKGTITDVEMWLEYYSYLVGYSQWNILIKWWALWQQRTVIKANRTFVGDGWGTYDTCFRQKSTFNKLLDSGQLDFTQYDETFAGRAQSTQKRYYRVNELHRTANCTYAPVDHLPSSFHLHGQSQRSISYSAQKQGMYLTTSHADMLELFRLASRINMLQKPLWDRRCLCSLSYITINQAPQEAVSSRGALLAKIDK